jgi:hypothetical protein
MKCRLVRLNITGGWKAEMNRVLTNNVWQQLRKLSQGHGIRKVAALAYVSTSRLLTFRKGDILVCDASDHAVRAGETSATVLARFYRAGAELYSCPYLHAKVLVLSRYVLIGSCNLSESSAKNLRELAVVLSDSSVRSQAVAFIHRLTENATPIDASFLKRIANIPVTKRRRRYHRKRLAIRLGDRTWVVRTHEIDPARYKTEQPLVEEAESEVKKKLHKPKADIGWVRFTGKSTFRSLAHEGDTIVDLYSLRRGKQITVYAPAAVRKRQDHGKWTRFYFETPGNTMSWTAFQRELKKLGIKTIKKNSTKELSDRDAELVDVIWEKW